MNPQTQELIKQFATDLLNRSGIDMREYEPFLEESEKLVEFVIRKCASISFEADDTWTNQGEVSRQAILEHFGVEE